MSLTLKISTIPTNCYNGYAKNAVKSGIKSLISRNGIFLGEFCSSFILVRNTFKNHM